MSKFLFSSCPIVVVQNVHTLNLMSKSYELIIVLFLSYCGGTHIHTLNLLFW